MRNQRVKGQKSEGYRGNLDSTRILNHYGHARVIVKNMLGQNKVLYIEQDGKSNDIDAIRKLSSSKLQIEGGKLIPLGFTQLKHSGYESFYTQQEADLLGLTLEEEESHVRFRIPEFYQMELHEVREKPMSK
mmetsp:Transcript_15367/g.14968  ORF Transcript_15367/g.14968 Transcript_15367/m.14968 type:complete len:132 (+) Transcript_15367:699-1094(+)